MGRALTTAATVLAAVVLQVTLVNRLPLPYGAVPSLVLILVAVSALPDGPAIGAITGFCAGLALDIAPPGSHLVGEYALVYCLIGFACGQAGRIPDLGALPAVLIAAVGAAAGEAMSAMLGVMFSDPEITWAAIRHVLPVAVVYDVLLTPFAFGLMVKIRPAADLGGRRSARAFRAPSPALAAAFSGGTGVRLAGKGSSPKLKLAGVPSPAIRPSAPRREPRLKLAGLTSPAFTPTIPRRDPKLKLSGSGPRHMTNPVTRTVRLNFSTAKARGTRTRDNARVPKFHRSRGPLTLLAGLLRPRRHAASPGRGWLKAKPPPKPRTPRSPGRKWLSGQRKTSKRRYGQKNWVRSSRRRRARSRLGGLR